MKRFFGDRIERHGLSPMLVGSMNAGDSVGPHIISATVYDADNLELEVVWSEPTNEPASATGVSLGGTAAAIDSLGEWSDPSTVWFVLDAPGVTFGETVTISFDAGWVEDLAGNGNAAIAAHAVDNQVEDTEFSPGDLGTVLSWVKGDDATFARSGSRVYSSLTDSGSLGGTWTAATNLHPVATLANSREVPQFGFGRRVQSSVSAENWDMFSDESSAVTLMIAFTPYSVGAATIWLGSTSNSRGCNVVLDSSGNVDVSFGNGSATTTLSDVGTVTANTLHVLTLTKDASGNILARLDDGSDATGSFTPSDGNPSAAPILGSASGSVNFHGIIHETVLISAEASDSQITDLYDYAVAEWTGTPEYSPLQGTVDCAAWYHAGHVALDVGVETLYDESGHNNHKTQSTDENQPSLLDPWRNGQPATDGDNTDMIVSAAFTQGTLAQPVTHYTVFESIASPAARYLYDGIDASNRQAVWLTTASQWAVFAGTQLTVAGVAGTRATVARVVYAGASTKYRFQQDGETEVSGAGNAGTQSLAGATTRGAHNGAWTYQDPIAERIIFAGIAGSDTAASDIHDLYLRDKYDIEAV